MLQQSLLAELQFEAQNTKKLFDAITDDVLDYKPNDFNWTIGQLASHTAEVYNWWPVTLHEDVFEMSTYKYEKGDITKIDSIREVLAKNIDRAVNALQDYPEENFFKTWSMQHNGVDLMPPTPRIQVIRGYLMNHLYHHRGELIAYLRANHKPVPGLYGMSYNEQMDAMPSSS